MGSEIRAWLQSVERNTGLDRPGRKRWVWLGPVVNFVGTVALVLWFAHFGELGLAAAIPLALFAGLFMAGTSMAYLGAFGRDADDDRSEEAAERRPQEPSRHV